MTTLGASLTLAAIMYLRWSKSGKFMPAGFISIISGAALLRNIIVYNQHLPLVGRSKW